MGTYQFILASQSPRRQELLTLLGVPFKVQAAQLNEEALEYQQLSASEKCLLLSLHKAKRISALSSNAVVLAADTLVQLGDEVLEKPKDKEQARWMLTKLSGQTHLVKTAFCLMNQERFAQRLCQTQVEFEQLSLAEIDWYLDQEDFLDKAGGYGIQSWAASFVKKINGCYFNVVGLPLSELKAELEKFMQVENWREVFY